MLKVDLKKEFRNFYSASAKEISLINVPPMNFITIDGSGDPNTAKSYQDTIEALYSLSYTIKFAIKKSQAIDYSVMPLEGLWWTDDMSLFSANNKDIWKWTAMIMQPEYVTQKLFDLAVQEVAKKKSLPALSLAQFQNFHEGLSVQIMHIGPYSAEESAIERLHNYIKEHDYTCDGTIQKHHEIYLSDYRRTVPDKLKTIIRQPFSKK